MTKLGDNFAFDQFQQSKVKNPVRSPFNRCLIKDVTVSDFVLDLKFQSTKKDYGHRDLCLFFGFQDPSYACGRRAEHRCEFRRPVVARRHINGAAHRISSYINDRYEDGGKD